jgi:hypothetical protein
MQDVFEYIELFYNPLRTHMNNGMLSTSKPDSRICKRRASGKPGAPHPYAALVPEYD